MLLWVSASLSPKMDMQAMVTWAAILALGGGEFCLANGPLFSMWRSHVSSGWFRLMCANVVAKRLCKVRNVRHQVRRKRSVGVKFVVIFMIGIVLMQHAIGGVQGFQLRSRQFVRDDGSGFQYSTFKDLPPPGNGSPRVLQLAEMLPVDGDETGTGNAASGVELAIDVPDRIIETLAALMHGPMRSMQTSEIDCSKLHEATMAVWSQWGPTTGLQRGVRAVHVYTDGSAGLHYGDYAYSRKAAWAFGVWLEHDQGRALLAADCGHVCTDKDSAEWTGAQWGSAAEGERAALLVGAVYVLRLQPTCPVHFWFDSTTAGFGASGRWCHNEASRDATLVRCVFQLLEARGSDDVHYGHVKAHQGDPYNELVNTLAYQALVSGRQRPVLDFAVADLLQGDKPWCTHWVTIYLASLEKPHYPGLEYGRLVWSRHQMTPHADIVWEDFRIRKEARKEASTCPLIFVSFNVRTLQYHRDDLALHGTVGAYSMLEEQLVDRAVDVVFLQETRSRSSHVLDGRHYKRFAVAAEAGHGGTEIWVSHQPRTSGGLQLLHGKNYIVLYQSAECLILRLELSFGALILVSAHAPNTGSEHSTVQAWWDDLTLHLLKYAASGYLIMGIDANAHFAHGYDDHVGDCGSETRENHAAPLFLSLLERCECWLPSTFNQYHFGVTTSWRHPGRGTWHRCDYIVISRSLDHDGLQSWVDGNLDAGGANVDHLAVALRVFLKLPAVSRDARALLGSRIARCTGITSCR